ASRLPPAPPSTPSSRSLIAAVPITAHPNGSPPRPVIPLPILSLIGLLLVPLITLAFTHQTVPLGDLVLQTILLIGLPMLVSRPLRRFPRVVAVRTSAVSVSFFFLVIAIAGSTLGPLLQLPELVLSLGS